MVCAIFHVVVHQVPQVLLLQVEHNVLLTVIAQAAMLAVNPATHVPPAIAVHRQIVQAVKSA